SDCDDGVCEVIDSGASNSTVFHYRAQAHDGGSTSAFSDVCREPLVQNQSNDNDDNRFRAFYRLSECPTFEGKASCAQNDTNGSGQNNYVMQTIGTLDAFRQEYIDLGFKDFAFYNGQRPFPVDMFPCNNGCANSQGIQIPPANLLGADYDPDTGGGS